MTDKRCPYCKFAVRATAQLNGPMQCRRNPPSVFMFPVGSSVMGQQQISMNTTFPQVDATTWCGEFEDKPASVAVIDGVRDPLAGVDLDAINKATKARNVRII